MKALTRTLFLLLFITYITTGTKVEALTISPVRLEIAADPGQTVTGSYKLINSTQSTQTFFSSVENFEAEGETGTPRFVQNDENLAAWVDTQSEITLTPGAVVDVPYSISVPQNAEPGGYFSAIFWSNTVPQEIDGSTTAT